MSHPRKIQTYRPLCIQYAVSCHTANCLGPVAIVGIKIKKNLFDENQFVNLMVNRHCVKSLPDDMVS